MFVEAHWKVLKWDFLYKFFRPQLDLVIFIIIEQVISHNQRKFKQLFVIKREKADWRKAFKREWKKLLIQTLNNIYLTDINNWIYRCPAFFINRFFICKHLIQEKGDVDVQFFNEVYHHHHYPFLDTSPLQMISNFNSSTLQISNVEVFNEDEDTKIYDKIYNRLIDVTERTLEILKDQQMKKNFEWVQNIEKNFKSIKVMLSEITFYKQRKIMPRTFKDYSHNTLFFN